jgi:hypothetical protein
MTITNDPVKLGMWISEQSYIADVPTNSARNIVYNSIITNMQME